jgi:membrane-bound lytic murein transglycosylase B
VDGRAQGRSAVTRHQPGDIDRALAGVAPVPQVLERDRAQAEFTLDLDAYLKRRLTPATVRMARQMYQRHRTLLGRVSERYGVDPRVLVSVWGLESNFGRFAGVRPTIPTLVTLAYDPRRAALFRRELFAALEILDRGDIELERLQGSWAGAMGQPQFLPSSYLRFAQDFDGDGRRDIWTSLPDVFASVAYYLQNHGWTPGYTWGREVRAPAALQKGLPDLPRREEGCRAARQLTPPRPLAEWRRMGLRQRRGRAAAHRRDRRVAPPGRLADLPRLSQLRSDPGLQLRSYVRAKRGPAGGADTVAVSSQLSQQSAFVVQLTADR